MRRDSTNYAMVGAFVIAMAAALLVVLFQLTGRGGATDVYYAEFGNTGGIKEGSLVTFEGHEVGRVGEITLRDASGKPAGKSRYLVALKVERGWKIPADSVATKTSFGLLAPMVVDLKAGTGEPLSPGKTIRAEDSSTMMEALTDVANRLTGITEQGLEPLLKRFGERVDRLGDNVEGALPGLLADLKATLAHTHNAARLLERALREENQQHLTRLLANTEATTRSFKQISAELEQTRARLDKLLDQSSDLIDANRQDIRASVQEIRQSLRRVNGMLHHFENTGRNMAEFSREIRENPSSLIQSSPPPDKSRVQRK